MPVFPKNILSGLPVSGRKYCWDVTNGLEGEIMGRKRLDMKKILRTIVPACLIGLLGIWPGAVFALSPEQVIALKKAGVSEETIRLMI
ncbi:MAG: hypothetical protein C0390_04770, partial [Syntrophus sp. (in: bacteria)]|nr:hypothetical protein [Syntrophus sp. (in: bacteria)]